MRADTHDGPEQIAPLQRPDTLMQLSRSSILEVHLVPHGRAIHLAQSGHAGRVDRCPLSGVKLTWLNEGLKPAVDPKRAPRPEEIPQCSGPVRASCPVLDGSMGAGRAARLESERRKASTCCVNLSWVLALVSATS